MRRILAGLVALLAVGGADAAAQVPGIDLKLAPRIGVYFPASDLGEAVSGAQQVTREMEGSLSVGLGLELDLPLSPINIRGSMDYATSSEVSASGISQDSIPESTLLAVTGDLVLRPLPRLIIVQPYLLAGAGVKWYDFTTEDLTSNQDLFPEDQTNFALHLGVGLDLTLGPLALYVEASDYLSWFEPEEGADKVMQNDIFASVGISVGLF